MSDTVTANLNYFTAPEDGSRPYTTANADEATGERPRNWAPVAKEVQITNLRGQEDSVTLDTAGFQYYKHTSAHTQFSDHDEIKRVYYPESAALLKKLTGANRVVIFDHTIRRHRPGVTESSSNSRQPALNAHVDQTPQYAERRVHMVVPDLAPELLKHRFQIINIWRPISHPALDRPLALCDYRSIDYEKDLVPNIFKLPDREAETFNVNYNPNHRWSYFRGLTPDEIILIKCLDTKTDGSVAIATPHTAFIDPTTPKDVPLRESIEVRAFVFYDNLPSED